MGLIEENDFDDYKELGAAAKRVPAWIRIILFVPALLLTIYWVSTYSGIYAVICDFQLDLFDNEYYPIFGFLIALIVPLLPVGIIVQVLSRTIYKDK